jgi:hypothetical protein
MTGLKIRHFTLIIILFMSVSGMFLYEYFRIKADKFYGIQDDLKLTSMVTVYGDKDSLKNRTIYALISAGATKIPPSKIWVSDDAGMLKWIDRKFKPLNNADDQNTVDAVIRDSIGVDNGLTQIEKSLMVSRFVISNFYDKKNEFKPSDYHNYVDLWKDIQAGIQPVSCYEFSVIYSLLANNIGIPTRVVFIYNPVISVSPVHTIAESYMADIGQWVAVDLQNGQAYAKDLSGSFLSAYKLAKTIINTDPDNPNIIVNNGYGENRDYYSAKNINNLFYLNRQKNYYSQKTGFRYSVYYPDNLYLMLPLDI